ncbi:MAG: hypothetical protein ACYC6C_10745 [Coriobacteriia bacterium]
MGTVTYLDRRTKAAQEQARRVVTAIVSGQATVIEERTKHVRCSCFVLVQLDMLQAPTIDMIPFTWETADGPEMFVLAGECPECRAVYVAGKPAKLTRVDPSKSMPKDPT